MRDYTQPHPDAIFKDKPTDFIEIYRPKVDLTDVACLSLEYLEAHLNYTESAFGITTIALFIIKPKTNKITLHKAEFRDLSNSKFVLP